MPRRRTASPRPSSPVRTSSYRAPPPQQRAPAPTASPMPGAAPSQGPGLMGQMAATAGGVAIGSAIGHSVGHMITGGGNSGGHPQEVQGQPQYAQQQQYQQPCEIEWKQFLECSQNSSDLGLCQTYNDLFKQCKSQNNM